jgi:hypothetical protein
MQFDLNPLKGKPEEFKNELIQKAKDVLVLFKSKIDKEAGSVSIKETDDGYEVVCTGISKKLEDEIKLKLSQ